MTRVSVMQPWLGDEEIAAVAAVISSGWVAQGPKVAEFEAAFAERMQADYAVAVSSCTAALHLSLVVAGIGPGDEVIVPSLSFVATTNAVVYVGATPVFADVDPVTGNVTADTIARVVTASTKAVIGVDQGGVPFDFDSVSALCDSLNITLIEDAACAAGSTYRGGPVGARARIATWSFHPRKIVTTGEGGMITTSDREWAVRARSLREHATSSAAAERHKSVAPCAEQYVEVGFNFRMTDMQAAMGIVQLGRLDEAVARRRDLARRYQEALRSVAGIRCVGDPEYGEANYQSFWVEVQSDYPINRDGLLLRLAQHDISARHGIMAAHRQPAYADLVATNGDLSTTETLTDNTVILPLFHQMTDDDQQRVIDVLARPGT